MQAPIDDLRRRLEDLKVDGASEGFLTDLTLQR
jgi:hypothetical protein